MNDKYRLVIMNDTTLERKFSYKLSRMNVFVALGALIIILVAGTTVLIAYTPLREYIPGYGDVTAKKELITLLERVDSLQQAIEIKDDYVQNIREVLKGKDYTAADMEQPKEPEKKDYSGLDYTRSKEDSMLRQEFEDVDQYSLFSGLRPGGSSIGNYFFFKPIQGVMSNGFNPTKKHFGIDIVAQKNEAIKSVLDGTVIFAGWTLQTGYVIAIQHQSNIISVYKHNSALLKREGEYVKAGDPIAIIGEGGELSTGPHLHFELWYDGRPVNPREYITF